MSILRVYLPSECDEYGVPLDWECCRLCHGNGQRICPDPGCPEEHPDHLGKLGPDRNFPCKNCEGHGSLKAAALEALAHDRRFRDFANPFRCKDCGHPMSEGAWEIDTKTYPSALSENDTLAYAIKVLRQDSEPNLDHVHYSLCDEGCRHGGPGMVRTPEGPVRLTAGLNAEDRAKWVAGSGPECIWQASWRGVDVRCLSWPHDLRPEQLAVLCLRCFANRINSI